MLKLAITAALKAGKEILNIYNNPNADFAIERKSDNSPLTIADKASHLKIEELLSATNIPLLSEEGKNIPYLLREKWERYWLVDPLDGTKEFIKKNGEFTVNIALIENQKPVLGVVYVPVSETLYWGETEKGAWKKNTVSVDSTWKQIQENATSLPVGKKDTIYTVAGSRSHLSPETGDYIQLLKKKYGEIRFISKGSSIKICMVAEGIADEYPRFGPTMEWDTAAGHAIANAAGKKLWLTDFSGELIYNKENLLNPCFIVK
ncbi:MAG: 3'(2'),5'-bisphosphate nucleotidase CysQ [Draconibacterium sp.]